MVDTVASVRLMDALPPSPAGGIAGPAEVGTVAGVTGVGGVPARISDHRNTHDAAIKRLKVILEALATEPQSPSNGSSEARIEVDDDPRAIQAAKEERDKLRAQVSLSLCFRPFEILNHV
jgi:hypothetical protein